MKDHGSETDNLFFALQDLLYTIQKKPAGTVKFVGGRDYLETAEYNNVVETHAHYFRGLSL